MSEIEASSGPLEMTIPLVVETLFSGDALAFPVAGPRYVSIGTEAQVSAEQRMFLSELMARISAEAISSFTLPQATTLRTIEVLVPRDDLPQRLEITVPLSIPCVVIPQGNDAWVVALPLQYTVFVPRDEDLAEAVRAEVKRMVAAEQRSALDYLRLFPARTQRLESLSIEVEREGRAPPGRASSLRKQLESRYQRKRAIEILESVATSLVDQRRGKKGPPLEGREQELSLLTSLLSGKDRLSVALVGPELSGKSALFASFVDREIEAGRDLLVYATSGAQLIAGMSGLGQWQERVRRVFDAAHQLDAIIYIESLGDLFAERGTGHVDLAGAMKPFLEENLVRLVGELRPDMVDHAESRQPGFFACLSRLSLDPLSTEQTERALRARVTHHQQREGDRPRLSPDAVAPLIDLAERYLPYRAFPGKAMRLYDELRAICEKDRTEAGDPAPITRERLYQVFSLSSGVPEFLLRDDFRLRVDDVIAQLQARLVGQREAVRSVAETVCVVKAGLQPRGKPLATFLFVGPTGVGKTELARALAAYLFGSAERLVRFDMSEFMDAEAASRLIHGTDRAEGLLTRKVREQPFCVLLLDEIEKASRAVFDLLLQVTGEGRLTDARGKTAYFHNAIIIMTSNLGATQSRTGAGFVTARDDESSHYARHVNQTFRPEFVNRIDRVIAFRSLQEDEALEVVRIALGRVAQRTGLLDANTRLVVSEAATRALARDGYSERYGARALRRHLEDHVVARAARLLSGLGDAGRECAVHVILPDEAGPEVQAWQRVSDVTAEGLRLCVVREAQAKKGQDLSGLEDVSRLRRRARAYTRIGRVEQVREQIEYIVAQLSYGPGKGADRRAAVEIGELHTELHRLKEADERVASAVADLEMIEELAMTAVFDGEPLGPLLRDAREAFSSMKQALVYELLCQEPRRDAVLLLLSEMDEGRALDVYVPPLLTFAEQRGFTVAAHVFRDRSNDAWPASRGWGPPREAPSLLTTLLDPERSFRHLLLSVRGPYAGVLLALEAGLLRFVGHNAKVDKAYLSVRRAGMRAPRSEDEWTSAPLTPAGPQELDEQRRGRPHRDFAFASGELHMGHSGNSLVISMSDYFRRFDEVAIDDLLFYEHDDGLDREAVFACPLDALTVK